MLTIREVIKTFYNALLQRLKKHRGNWEQNDPTADDYIKNRPFYTEGTKETILVNNYTGNGNCPECNFVVGQAYNVTWNGTLYENVICEESDVYNALGGYNYPFYIDDDGGDSLYVAADMGTFSVSISIIQEDIHKIDQKYLPYVNNLIDENALRPDYEIYDATQIGYIKNRPCYYDSSTYQATGLSQQVYSYFTNISGAINTEVDFRPENSYRVIIDVAGPFGLTSTSTSSTFHYEATPKFYHREDTTVAYITVTGILGVNGVDYECTFKIMNASDGGETSVKLGPVSGGFTQWINDIEVKIETIKQLDEHVIPNTIARKSDLEGLGGGLTEERVNELIDTKLGVIENGTY